MSANSGFIFLTSSLAMAQSQLIRFDREDIEVTECEPATKINCMQP